MSRTQAPDDLKNLGLFRIMFEKWPDCTALQETAINAGVTRVSAKVAALAPQRTPTESPQHQRASVGSGPELWSRPRLVMQRRMLRVPSTYCLKSSSSSISLRKPSLKSWRSSSSCEPPQRPSAEAVPDCQVQV
eukprot:6579108-Prymnesium_polylepis.1